MLNNQDSLIRGLSLIDPSLPAWTMSPVGKRAHSQDESAGMRARAQAQSRLVSSADPIKKLEHDHVPVGQLLEQLLDCFAAIERGKQPADAMHAMFSEALSDMSDELLEHFAREEEGLFPLLLRELPALEPQVEAVQSAHDGICGALVRISHLVQRGPAHFAEHFAHVRVLFERFQQAYAAHARDERTLLRQADQQLNDQQRAELAGLLEGL